MSRVYQRGSRWYVDYSVGGKRIRKSVGKETEARRFLRELSKGEESVTWGTLLENFQRHLVGRQKPTTQTRYKVAAKVMLPFFGSLPIQFITPELIERYIETRRLTVKNSTINRELAMLRHSLNYAWRNDWLDKNPFRRVEFLPEPQPRCRVLTLTEIDQINQAAPKWMKPIIIIALNTGMRRNEIVDLRWCQVNFTNRTILLEETKTGARRSVPMNDVVVGILKSLPRRLNCPWCFFNPLTGRRWGNVSNAFSRAIKRAGLTDVHFHDLRHTFASYLVMAGEPLNTVRELLGHKSIKMTLRYAHLATENTHLAVRRLSATLCVGQGELLTFGS